MRYATWLCVFGFLCCKILCKRFGFSTALCLFIYFNLPLLCAMPGAGGRFPRLNKFERGMHALAALQLLAGSRSAAGAVDLWTKKRWIFIGHEKQPSEESRA